MMSERNQTKIAMWCRLLCEGLFEGSVQGSLYRGRKDLLFSVFSIGNWMGLYKAEKIFVGTCERRMVCYKPWEKIGRKWSKPLKWCVTWIEWPFASFNLLIIHPSREEERNRNRSLTAVPLLVEPAATWAVLTLWLLHQKGSWPRPGKSQLPCLLPNAHKCYPQIATCTLRKELAFEYILFSAEDVTLVLKMSALA